MANTKSKKKTGNEILTPSMEIRIIAMIILFLGIVGALQLGIVGDFIHMVVTFLVGDLYYAFYAFLLIVCLYILFMGKTPRWFSPIEIGIYLVLVGVMVLLTYQVTPLKGTEIIGSFISSQTYNMGGFIGCLLFALFSGLFDSFGALIAGGFLVFIGISLIIAKVLTYYQKPAKKSSAKSSKKAKTKKDNQNKADSHTNKIVIETKPRRPFEKKESITIFPDDVFEEPQSKEKATQASPKSADTKKPTETKKPEKKPEVEVVEKPPKINTPKSIETKPLERKKYKDYQFPPLSLFKTKSSSNYNDEKAVANDNAQKLTGVLKQFGVKTTVENISIGPSITKYELKLEVGTRVNKILQLQDDIKLALASSDIRIEAPIPGKPYVGVEVSKSKSSIVAFKDVFQSAFQDNKYSDNRLAVILGKDISGNPVVAELDKMPHLLIAGATGSGKSVCINTIIISILMRAHPDEVKLILVDPKKVELSIYNGIPHLAAPVVSDPKKAAGVLHEVVNDMEDRYNVFAQANVRNIAGYNDYVKKYNENLEKGQEKKDFMPYMVVILDEVADLMMVASKDVEDCIMRIAQLARAAGIHLIVATQRPSTDIITGVIKANIPSRIAFAVSSSVDSRTILDTSGAERLLGKGDMLFSPMGSSSPIRVQGAFVSDQEVSDVVDYVTHQREASYEDKYVNVKSVSSSSNDDEDEEYEECREFVIENQKASTSLLQRRFKIGYNKAARIIDQLEANGVIGPQNGSKPREVYIKKYDEEDI